MPSDNRVPYVYKLTEQSTGKWYIGSRTGKGCNPADGYMGSSKVVTARYKENTSDWIKEIIAIGTIQEMLDQEMLILIEADAKNNLMSYNQVNGDGTFSSAGIPLSAEHRMKISLSTKGVPKHRSLLGELNRVEAVKRAVAGKPQSVEHIAKRSAAMTGKVQTAEHKKKRSDALKSYHRHKKDVLNK